MDPLEYILVGINLVAGLAFAVPIAKLLGKARGKPKRATYYFVRLIGVYFLESAAIIMGMLLPVFSVGLAFVWGIILGFWLDTDCVPQEVLKASFFFSLYSSLPTASFILVPPMLLAGGFPILSTEGGRRLGIPTFVPWPLSTIVGFFVVIAIGTLILKTVITTGEVSLLIHLRGGTALGRRDAV